MKAKFYSLMLVACLLFTSLPVEAANSSLSKAGDSVTYTAVTQEFSITEQGSYTFSVAGSKGGTYFGTADKGDIVTYTADLNIGDIVKVVSSAAPSNYTTTADAVSDDGTQYYTVNVNAGTNSVLYINGVEKVRAVGGAATTRNYGQATHTSITLNNSKGGKATFPQHVHDSCNQEDIPIAGPCKCSGIITSCTLTLMNCESSSSAYGTGGQVDDTEYWTYTNGSLNDIQSRVNNYINNLGRAYQQSSDWYYTVKVNYTCAHLPGVYRDGLAYNSVNKRTWSLPEHTCSCAICCTGYEDILCPLPQYGWITDSTLTAPAYASSGGTIQTNANNGNGYVKVTCNSIVPQISSLSLGYPNFVSKLIGTEFEFKVPYSGYYQITLAGSQGGTYNSTAVAGTKLTQKVWLDAGTVLSGSTTIVPSNTWDGSTFCVHGGSTAVLYKDGVVYAKAAAGNATTAKIAPANATTVRVYSTDDVSYKESPVHWHKGNSYTYGNCYIVYNFQGTRTRTVEGPACEGRHYHGNMYNPPSYVSWTHCCKCCSSCNHSHTSTESYTYYYSNTSGAKERSGDSFRFYSLGCGYEQGEVRPIPATSKGADYNPNGMTVSTNTGAGYFQIQLCEQGTLAYNNVRVKVPIYNSRKYNVVVNNDTVVYCKYGNLN